MYCFDQFLSSLTGVTFTALILYQDHSPSLLSGLMLWDLPISTVSLYHIVNINHMYSTTSFILITQWLAFVSLSFKICPFSLILKRKENTLLSDNFQY